MEGILGPDAASAGVFSLHLWQCLAATWSNNGDLQRYAAARHNRPDHSADSNAIGVDPACDRVRLYQGDRGPVVGAAPGLDGRSREDGVCFDPRIAYRGVDHTAWQVDPGKRVCSQPEPPLAAAPGCNAGCAGRCGGRLDNGNDHSAKPDRLDVFADPDSNSVHRMRLLPMGTARPAALVPGGDLIQSSHLCQRRLSRVAGATGPSHAGPRYH